MLYHIAKVSTPLPSNLIATRSVYGREIADVQIPLPSWQSTPSVSFVEAGTTSYNLGQNVSNYSSVTDEFRVTPTYSLPAWLSLTGTGGGNLTPNGTQLDANDIPASPGIKIDVRRSGGAWVSSSAFGVTVYVAGSGVATWNDWEQFSYAYGSFQADPGSPAAGNSFGQWASSDTELTNYGTWQTYSGRITAPTAANNFARTLTPIYGGFFSPVWDEEFPLVCVVPG